MDIACALPCSKLSVGSFCLCLLDFGGMYSRPMCSVSNRCKLKQLSVQPFILARGSMRPASDGTLGLHLDYA